ncbi:MAG: CYTH and CHAD domain-containing protein [Candidatus Accumulibacter sp.]|jgi:inorganic triphosphatase YgiF|nr:CYTH and CHAD domain-containing protein [Accumulibacter sp.]
MSSEIELKLSLSPAQARRVARQPALAGVEPRRQRLTNIYFDTPDLELRRRGIALRLRRKGGEWLMTVKGGDPAAGALARRAEWEAPTRPGAFDFGIVDDESLRAFLAARQPDLRPVFTTEFTRTAWIVQRGPARVEIALDRGRIAAPGPDENAPPAEEAILEIELELIEGESSDALFDLAIELACGIHLHPAIDSKADRGYRLAAGETAAPARADPSPLARGMTPGDAFRAMALSCLLHLQRNERGVAAGRDAECLHQARVAIRRLRSCFRVFAPALAPAFVKVYLPRWRELGRALGGTRDWDVFLLETLAPLEQAFPGDASLARLRERGLAVQTAAREAAAVALTGQDYGRLALAFAAALYREEPPTFASAKAARRGLRRFARRRLKKCFAAVKAIARKPARLDDAAWHRLRIAFKRLRYALEFFAPLLPKKRLRRYRADLAAILELLGQFNDQSTAARLIAELLPPSAPLSVMNGWIAGRKHLLAQTLTESLAGFFALRRPW